jgi:DNA replication protein DnaD
MTERLGLNYVDKVRNLIKETDLVDELAKKQKVGWASISQLSMLHQKQQLAKRAIGKSETRESLIIKQETKFSSRDSKSTSLHQTKSQIKPKQDTRSQTRTSKYVTKTSYAFDEYLPIQARNVVMQRKRNSGQDFVVEG